MSGGEDRAGADWTQGGSRAEDISRPRGSNQPSHSTVYTSPSGRTCHNILSLFGSTPHGPLSKDYEEQLPTRIILSQASVESVPAIYYTFFRYIYHSLCTRDELKYGKLDLRKKGFTRLWALCASGGYSPLAVVRESQVILTLQPWQCRGSFPIHGDGPSWLYLEDPELCATSKTTLLSHDSPPRRICTQLYSPLSQATIKYHHSNSTPPLKTHQSLFSLIPLQLIHFYFPVSTSKQYFFRPI